MTGISILFIKFKAFEPINDKNSHALIFIDNDYYYYKMFACRNCTETTFCTQLIKKLTKIFLKCNV